MVQYQLGDEGVMVGGDGEGRDELLSRHGRILVGHGPPCMPDKAERL